MERLVFLTLAILLTFNSVLCQDNATCSSLYYQENFYQYIPLFLGKTYYSDEIQTLKGLNGSCFNKIDIQTQFILPPGQTIETTTQVRVIAKLILIDAWSIFCFEHLMMSTTLNDYYDFYFAGGNIYICILNFRRTYN